MKLKLITLSFLICSPVMAQSWQPQYGQPQYIPMCPIPQHEYQPPMQLPVMPSPILYTPGINGSGTYYPVAPVMPPQFVPVGRYR